MKKTNIKRFLFVILFVIFLVGAEGTPVNASNTTEYYQEISELTGIQFFPMIILLTVLRDVF